MKKVSLAQKMAVICSMGIIKQLSISDLDAQYYSNEIGRIAEGWCVFEFTPFEPNKETKFPFSKIMQAVASPASFIKNVYSCMY